MVLVYTVDRFEGKDRAVLEDERAQTFDVPRSWLPAKAREGSVIRVSIDDQSDTTGIRLALDAEETTARLHDAERRRQNLPRGPKGDVSL